MWIWSAVSPCVASTQVGGPPWQQEQRSSEDLPERRNTQDPLRKPVAAVAKGGGRQGRPESRRVAAATGTGLQCPWCRATPSAKGRGVLRACEECGQLRHLAFTPPRHWTRRRVFQKPLRALAGATPGHTAASRSADHVVGNVLGVVPVEIVGERQLVSAGPARLRLCGGRESHNPRCGLSA